MPAGPLKLLHHLFAFVFVGSLFAAHWNALAARRTADAARQAALFEANARTAAWFGLPSLLLLGVFGNLAATALGYRMGLDSWLRWADGLWVALVLVEVLVDLPATRRLAALAGGGGSGIEAALTRWRVANGLALVFFVAFLGLMVFRWRF